MYAIIGNGFDLNLGLETSYKHFIASNEFQAISHSRLSRALMKEFHSKHPLWVDIEIFLDEYLLSISERNEQKRSGVTLDAKSFNEDYLELKETLFKYLQRVSQYPIDHNSEAAKFVKKLANNTIVFNFNFTGSFQRLTDWEDYKNLYYIHGSLDEGNIIFGAGGTTKNINKKFRYAKKSFADNFTTEFHSRLGKSSRETGRKKLDIFGHSLGVSDHNYFAPMFNQRADALDITLYHYEEEGKNNLLAEIDEMINMEMHQFRNSVASLNFQDVSRNQ